MNHDSMQAAATGRATEQRIGPAWAADAAFYHIYPLGLLGLPERNPAPGSIDLPSFPGGEPFDRLGAWVDHIAGLGFTAVYLGPVFESVAHGYDTVDYFRVDRRLGTNAGLRRFVDRCHAAGVRVVLDAVFNHVGREFPAFRALRAQGKGAAEAAWFSGLDFSRSGPAGDSFAYEGWHGHYDLVKLNLDQGPARTHLLDAVRCWVDEFDIDGLRLDAADCLSHGFMEALAGVCQELKPDFWLMGEVVHGDYRRWANPASLHSVTNYEAYKGLWSSLNDINCWEIDWTLKRQFASPASGGAANSGERGLYRGLSLYNFVDNHDVERAASVLKDPEHLPTLYALMCSIPGAPSVYYGSEWGVAGRKLPDSDRELRPALDIGERCAREARGSSERPGLCGTIYRLLAARMRLAALRHGSYRPVAVENAWLAFWRDLEGKAVPAGAAGGDLSPVLVALNASPEARTVRLPVEAHWNGRMFRDALDPDFTCRAAGGALSVSLGGRQVRWLTPV